MAMVSHGNGPSPQPDALRAEIDLLRAAVAALRATRAAAFDAAREQARAATSLRSRVLIATSLLSFVLGVGITAALGVFAIYLGLCP
jgi:hypothetical protein